MKNGITIQPNLLDRAIEYLSPKMYAQRIKQRAAAQMLQQQMRRYDAAGHGRRTSGWFAPGTSAQSEVQNAISYLRNRSREMVRNNPYAENAIREIANNAIGTGIIPKALGLPKTINKRLKALWAAWADETGCDYDGHANLYGIQHLAVSTMAESGEAIIRMYYTPGQEIPLQLQVLEGDYIDSTKFGPVGNTGNFIRYGVEFNSKNKVVAYWLYDNHPGDSMQYSSTSNRISSEEIIYLFEKKRPGQFRGVPFGHAAMLALKDLSEYEDAQLIRQKIAACFSVFVTDTDTSGTLGTKNSGAADANLEKVEPGIIEYLPPGKQVTMANPPDAGANYDPYVKSVLRGVAVGYGMDYVTLTGDYTAVNYSSGRMGWLKFQRNIDVLQWNRIIPQMCNKIWNWFVQSANIMGYIRQDKVPVSWTPPRRQMIDPVKEIKGLEAALRAGLISWPEAIRQNGDDPDEVLEEMKQAAEMFDKAGLKPTSDPRYDAGNNAEEDIDVDMDDEEKTVKKNKK